ncbi:MAG: hypothetical protein LBT51_03590 [Fusobacteriaceae bacterium]|nr:hypothetical protein [Fusobacteriaceae bacterium]
MKKMRKIKKLRAVILKEEYFENMNIKVPDNGLLWNKTGRPTIIVFPHPTNENLSICIPLTSDKNNHYKNRECLKIKKYGKCNTIIFDNFNGVENAYLIQNMFPISNKYIHHSFRSKGGNDYYLNKKLSGKIFDNAKKVFEYYKKGVKNEILTKFNEIEEVLVNEIKKEKNKGYEG